MPQEVSSYELYFDDPRLRMTVAGRFTVRVLSYVAYLVLIFATGTFLMSEIMPLRAAGIFLVLFFIDRIVHWGEADVPISELPARGKINLARFIKPSAFGALSRAFDHGLMAKRDFFLGVADRLMNLEHMEEGLRRLDVKPEEFKAKVGEFLARPVPAGVSSRETYLKNAEALVVAAFGEALAAGHDNIEPSDLFSALIKVKSEMAERVFNMFSIDAGDLERALIFLPKNAFSGGCRARSADLFLSRTVVCGTAS